MLKIVDDSCLLFDEEYSLLRWKSYNSETRTDHAKIFADDLLLKVFQIAQVKEENWFRGSRRLNTNDCIVGNMTAYSLVFVILMLKWWWPGTWFIMMRFYALVADKDILCSHMDELDVVWFRNKNRSSEFVTMVEIFFLHMLLHVKSWRSWWYWTTWMISWHIFEDVVLVW